MTHVRSILALSLCAALPVAAARPQDSSARDFYRAFYEETALRDFAAAAESYAGVLARADLPADLRARAQAGRARALQALGELDEAAAAWRAVLELDPENGEARAALARSPLASPDERLDAEIRAHFERLVSGDAAALENVCRFGSRAVPILVAAWTGEGPAQRSYMAAEALVAIALRDDSALALEELAAGLRGGTFAPSALGVIVHGVLSADYRTSRAGVYGALLEQSDIGVRQKAAEYLVGQGLRKLDEQREEGLLPLIERMARDESFLVRRELLLFASGSDALDGLPTRSRAVVSSLVERSLRSELPEEQQAARSAAVGSRPLLRAHARELVPALASGELAPRGWASGFARSLEQGWFEPAEVLAFLEHSDPTLRTSSWSWLVAHVGEPTFATLDDLRPHAVRAAQDWGLTMRSSDARALRDQWNSLFAPFAFSPALHVQLWETLVRMEPSRGFNGFDHRLPVRAAIVEALFSEAKTVEQADRVLDEALAAFADPELVASFLADVPNRPPPPAWSALQRAAASDAKAVREQAYGLLLQNLATRGERPEAWSLPRLFEDVASSLPGALSLFAQIGDPALVDEFERRLPEIAEETQRSRVLGVVIGLGDPSRLAATWSTLREPGQFGPVTWSLLDGLGIAPGTRGRPWIEAKLELARSDHELLRYWIKGGSVAVWPYDAATQLVQAALTTEGTPDEVLEHALGWAGNRNLGVPLEVLLPFVRHGNPTVRAKAEQATERVRSLIELERAALSFGDDARARSVEAIRANVASPEADRRRAAAWAIAALGDPDGVALLFDLLGDPEAAVRAAALAALERLGVGKGD